MKLWPHQERGIAELWQAIEAGRKRIVFTSPTGGGKTVMMAEVLREAKRRNWTANMLTHRTMLRKQLSENLTDMGIPHGIRASGHWGGADEPIQVSMIQTESGRLDRYADYELHKSNLVLIDECHAETGERMKQIMDKHIEAGAVVVGVTATPLDIWGLGYDTLVVAGKNSELRQCGAHVPCFTYAPDEPDARELKANTKTGEYTEGSVSKAILTPTIFGRVFDHWRRLNPDARPAILFGPSVRGSMFFVDEFRKAGVAAVHIDGEHVYFGEHDSAGNEVLHTVSDELREEIKAGSASGKYPVVCNRFVLREGIDLPFLFHCIMATAFGSLQSFLQSGGRLLRSHPSLDHVILQDHGGNWHRHGSLNADREWSVGATAIGEAAKRKEGMEKKKPEEKPCVCAKCGMVRKDGMVCPQCGFKMQKHVRMVVQKDGSLKPHYGDIYRPRVVKETPQDEKNWKQIYYQFRNSGKTFDQAYGFFRHKFGYWPPKNLPLMPINEGDWKRKVSAVEYSQLTRPTNSQQRMEME